MIFTDSDGNELAFGVNEFPSADETIEFTEESAWLGFRGQYTAEKITQLGFVTYDKTCLDAGFENPDWVEPVPDPDPESEEEDVTDPVDGDGDMEDDMEDVTDPVDGDGDMEDDMEDMEDDNEDGMEDDMDDNMEDDMEENKTPVDGEGEQNGQGEDADTTDDTADQADGGQAFDICAGIEDKTSDEC